MTSYKCGEWRGLGEQNILGGEILGERKEFIPGFHVTAVYGGGVFEERRSGGRWANRS